jgi:D-3-phosphoglycerate dehydrogenase / 2-oxoglutarate reductase
VKKLSLSYAGEVCDFPTSLLTMAALKGLLSGMLSDTINFVNAQVIAKERGIEVAESTTKETQDFTSQISLRVESEKGEREIVGTLIGKKREPRVVSVFGFHTDFLPTGILYGPAAARAGRGQHFKPGRRSAGRAHGQAGPDREDQRH